MGDWEGDTQAAEVWILVRDCDTNQIHGVAPGVCSEARAWEMASEQAGDSPALLRTNGYYLKRVEVQY